MDSLLPFISDSILLLAVVVVAVVLFPKYRQIAKDRIESERQAAKDKIESDEKMWKRWGERESNLLNVINECTSVMSGLKEVIHLSVQSNKEHLQTLYTKVDQMSKGNMRIETKVDTVLQNQWQNMGQPILKNAQYLNEEISKNEQD